MTFPLHGKGRGFNPRRQYIHCMHALSTLPRFTMLPEWSKGLHLRCTVFALAGSNPAHSSLTFPFFGLNAALRPLRFDAIQVFFKGPALWPFEPNHKEHVQCPTSSRRRLRRALPDVNHQGPPNGSVRKSVRTRFSPPLRLVLSTLWFNVNAPSPRPRHRPSRRPRPRGRASSLAHALLAYPSAQAVSSSVPTHSCHLRIHNARACGQRDIDKHHSRIATSRTRRRTTWCPFY